jgi:hypothetical protein
VFLDLDRFFGRVSAGLADPALNALEALSFRNHASNRFWAGIG